MPGTGDTRNIRALIERSSLGTEAASQLRARTPRAQAKLVAEIVHHRERLAACREAGDHNGTVQALAYLSNSYHIIGRHEEAVEAYQEMLVSCREAGDRKGVLLATAGLMTTFLALDRLEEALAMCQEALAVSREMGEPESKTRLLTNLAGILRGLGRHEEVQTAAAQYGVAEFPDENLLPEFELRRAAGLTLTRRESDVLTSLCRHALPGEALVAPATARQIAEDLVITEAAVKQHLLQLYRKFGIAEGPNRRVRLANEAIRLELAPRTKSPQPGSTRRDRMI